MAENQASNAAADVEMSQYVADRTRVNEDKIKQDDEIIEQFGDYNYGWHDTDFAGEAAKKGIDENVVRAISADKHEPEWMLEKRLEGYRDFIDRPMPQWGVDLKDFDADDFKYYVKPIDKQATTWEELPDEIRSTYDKLGIPEAEKSRLVSGVAAQYESEVIYNSIQKDLEEQGVIFVDTDTAVQKYPELVKKYFGKCIPSNDNKFSALNTAAWSGGSFVYVPKGVHVDIPLQAYFRINTPNMGQFERTLIIADEGSYVHYVEGCTAPIYSTDSLHSGVVEIFVEPHARVRYTTVQNWSNNVYNLVTQRAYVGFRGQGPISGHGREDDSPRPAYQLHHRGEVDFPWRRTFRIPWPRQNRQGRGRVLQFDGLRRFARRRIQPFRHVPACGCA